MPAELTAAELAENYGFALSFLRSDKSLWDLFQKANDDDWTNEKFIAQLKNTSWWKRNGEQARQYFLLKSTDPATLTQRRAGLRAQLADMANAMGASVSQKVLNSVTENALMLGWNDAQVRDQLSGFIRAKNGVYHGQAGDDIASLKEVAWRNGLRLTSQAIQGWSRDIAAGNHTVDFYQRRIRQLAKSVAPGFSEELDAGMDLWDIAEPYIQSKARLLEVNPANVDLFDEDIRGALSGKDRNGKPASQTLWEFEQNMRRKPEWLKTKNAQDSVLGVAKKVLNDMGFQGV
jgi:hypothetical protein